MHLGHRAGLVQQRPVGVQRHLRRAGRARGAERDGERRRIDGAEGAWRGAPGREVVVGGDEHRRRQPVEHPVAIGGAGQVVDRRGDRAEPPAGAVQGDGGPPVGPLPARPSRRLDAQLGQPAGDRVDLVLDLGRGGAGERVGRASRPTTDPPTGSSARSGGACTSGSGCAPVRGGQARVVTGQESARTLSLTAPTIGGRVAPVGDAGRLVGDGVVVLADLGPVGVVELVQREARLPHVLEAHVVDALVDRFLDEQRGHRRELGDAPGELERLLGQVVEREHLRHHAEGVGLVDVDRVTGEHELPWSCGDRTPTGGRSTRCRTCRGGCRPRRRSARCRRRRSGRTPT